MDILAIIGGIVGLVVIIQISATPTITVAEPDENDCQRVTVTRFWEQSTMLDAVTCDGMPISFNGENLLETD